ncbi:MAG: hypothetical protein IAE63_04185 [Alphaproteobacteria bacterium]|nr:hypothetical protein [Alphaproteobacteria bacterium]
MFFTDFIAKRRHKAQRIARHNLYWGIPDQKYAFGHPFLDGLVGAAIGTILILSLIAW